MTTATQTREIRSIDVTPDMVRKLREEAAEAGDLAMVKHCDLANTNVDSFRLVLEALRDAAAQS
jgi:hypothetical protein